MFVVKEGPGIKVRATILASEALLAQLNMLQVFLPLPGWLVSKSDGQQSDMVAATGVFDPLPCEQLERLLQENWQGARMVEDFYYRLATEDERQWLQEHVAVGTQGLYLVMADLCEPDGRSVGRVLGLAPETSLSGLIVGADKIALCLQAMMFTVALQAELDAAEQLVVEMQHDAFTDPLTGIFNRAGWINRLSHIDDQASASDEDAAIVMLDLDFLKVVNDSQGHAAGDDLLRLTAQTISSVLRNSDSVGRLGGDEFGVVIQHATPMAAERLLDRLKEALAVVDIQISIGMALRSESGSLKNAMHLADQRMYIEKRKKSLPVRTRATDSDSALVANGNAA